MANLHSQLDSHCIHGGYLYKKGVYNRAWKKRYFVLFDDRTISYFEKEKHSKSRNKAKGSIHLTQISRVELVHYKFNNNNNNTFPQKTKFNEIRTNDIHRTNPPKKHNYKIQQNHIKQNNPKQKLTLKLHRQQSEPHKKAPKPKQKTVANSAATTPTKDITPNLKISLPPKTYRKYKKINNDKQKPSLIAQTLQSHSKDTKLTQNIEIPITKMDTLPSKSLPKNLNQILSDDEAIFSPESIVSKQKHLNSYNSERTNKNILSPKHKNKTITVKRPASITMNGWAFFDGTERNLSSSPINSAQRRKGFSISQSHTSYTSEEEEADRNFFTDFGINGKHRRRRSSSFGDLPRPLSATARPRHHYHKKKEEMELTRPQSATFSPKKKRKHVHKKKNKQKVTSTQESHSDNEEINININEIDSFTPMTPLTDEQLTESDDDTSTSTSTSDAITKPKPSGNHISAPFVHALIPHLMTKSAPTDLQGISEEKERGMELKNIHIAKYHRRRNKKRNKDIIVSDNIRKFNRQNSNDEELSQSFSLYSSIIENTKSNLSAGRRYAFALIQPNRNWILSAEKESDCKKWVALFNKLVQGKHVFSGYLIKRGKNIKSWKKRFFVLFENKVLNYYHNKNIDDKGALIGDIDLRHTMWLRMFGNIDNEFKSIPNIDDFFNNKPPMNSKRRSVSILNRRKHKKNKQFQAKPFAAPVIKAAIAVDLNQRSKGNASRIHYKSFSWGKKEEKSRKNECFLFEIATPNRTWIFCAENENVRNTWYAQIRDLFYDKLILKIYFDSPCHIEIIHMGQNLKNRYAALLKGWLIIFRDKTKLNNIRKMTFFSDTIFRDYVRNKNCICIPLKDADVVQNFKSVYGQFSFEIKIQDRCWYFNVENNEILSKWIKLLNIQYTNSDIDYSKVEQSYSNLPSIMQRQNNSNNREDIIIPSKQWLASNIEEELEDGSESMEFQHVLDTTLEDINTPVSDVDDESIDFICIN